MVTEDNKDHTPEETAKVVSSRMLYNGREIKFRVDSVVTPCGHAAQQELLIYPPSVCIAAHTEDARFILIRQYRHSTGEVIWEAPAGKILPGETPEDGARRELEEETGYRSAQWEKLFEGFTAPGISTEKMYFFLARAVTSGPRRLDDDESIQVYEVAAEDVRNMLINGDIQDVKTALVLHLALKKLQERS